MVASELKFFFNGVERFPTATISPLPLYSCTDVMNVVGFPLIVDCLNSFCEPETNVGLFEKLNSPAFALQKYCELTWSSSSLNLEDLHFQPILMLMSTLL